MVTGNVAGVAGAGCVIPDIVEFRRGGSPGIPALAGTAHRLYIQLLSQEIPTAEVEMAKTLVDVNEEYLAAAQEVLHTESEKDTINAALRMVASLAARRRDLQRLVSGGLPDLEDAEVMRAAWQR